MSSLIWLVRGGVIHRIGFLYPLLFIIGLPPLSVENLFGQTVFSRMCVEVLAMNMIAVLTITLSHLQALYMIIRYWDHALQSEKRRSFCLTFNSNSGLPMTWLTAGLPDLSYRCKGYGLRLWTSGNQFNYMRLY